MNQLISLIPIVEEGEPCLACPVCGFSYVHPVGVRCNPAGAMKGLVAIDYAGIRWDAEVPVSGRGVLIELRFVCEAGHVFGYEFHFHKGQTQVARSQCPDNFIQRTIWRN